MTPSKTGISAGHSPAGRRQSLSLLRCKQESAVGLFVGSAGGKLDDLTEHERHLTGRLTAPNRRKYGPPKARNTAGERHARAGERLVRPGSAQVHLARRLFSQCSSTDLVYRRPPFCLQRRQPTSLLLM